MSAIELSDVVESKNHPIGRLWWLYVMPFGAVGWPPPIAKDFKMLDKSSGLSLERELWCIDFIEQFGEIIIVSGWAMPIDGDQDRGAIFINGEPAKGVYGALRSEIGFIYPYAANSMNSGFAVSARITNRPDRIQISYIDTKTAKPVCEYHSYYFPIFPEGAALPSKEFRTRTTGPISDNTFKLGGFTLAMKLDAILFKTVGKRMSEFDRVLDWGGGCGRVTRYLKNTSPEDERISVAMADIDAGNVGWVAENFGHIETYVLPLMPPSSLPENSFDLVIGNSVFTHLQRDAQFAWLEELSQTLKPGGIAAVTIHNVKDVMRATNNEQEISDFLSAGFADRFPDDALNGFISDSTYYRATFHTHDYVRHNWSRHFEIVDIVTDFSNNHQDLVIMRNIKQPQ